MTSGEDCGGGGVVYGHKLSTVVPGTMTGDGTVEHPLTGADLALKLHYIKSVYFFPSAAAAAPTIFELKKPMFPWLDAYPAVAGRVRRGEGGGRPYVKCNDCGVRIVEAECRETVEEWMEAARPAAALLAPAKVIGPEVFFSPLLYIQFTKFKCGGLAIGFSWAHLLGDIAAASSCFNHWARLFSGGPAADKPAASAVLGSGDDQQLSPAAPLSASAVEVSGDHWIPANKSEMASFTFKIAEDQMAGLRSTAAVDGDLQVGDFELITAFVWRCIARLRRGAAPDTVTVCRAASSPASGAGELGNKQRIGYVTAENKTEVAELAAMVVKNFVDETGAVARDGGERDLVVYGGMLTFVDALGVDLYGMKMQGRRPVDVEIGIDGVGDEGAVVVYSGGGGAAKVSVVLPAKEIVGLQAMVSDRRGFI